MSDEGSSENVTRSLVEQAIEGDSRAWERLMSDNRSRLRRMVALRMDRRLQGRVDPSDVIQEAFIDAARRLPEFVNNPTVPFFVWLRRLTGQRLMEQHRRHLGAQDPYLAQTFDKSIASHARRRTFVQGEPLPCTNRL